MLPFCYENFGLLPITSCSQGLSPPSQLYVLCSGTGEPGNGEPGNGAMVLWGLKTTTLHENVNHITLKTLASGSV